MVRVPAMQKSTRLVLVCVGLLGFALVANYLRASSPHISKWAVVNDSVTNLIIPRNTSSPRFEVFRSFYTFGSFSSRFCTFGFGSLYLSFNSVCTLFYSIAEPFECVKI